MSFADRWCLMRFGARPADVSAAAFVSDVFQRLMKSGGRALRFPHGLASLLNPLVAGLGSRLLRARVAVLVKPDGGGAKVRVVNALDAVVTDYEATAVILAVPPFVAARISPPFRDRASAVELPKPSPWLITAVQVSRWPKNFDPRAPFCQTTDERASLIAHVDTPPAGVIVFHRPFPSPAVTPARMFLRDLDAGAARDWAMRELAPVLPDLATVATRVELFRIAHASTRPGTGYLTTIAPRLRAPIPPISPCGADLGGLPCIESAIEDGVRAAEDVLRALGKLDRSWL
jgi:hypothetical protein